MHGTIPKAEDHHCTSGTKNIHPTSARLLDEKFNVQNIMKKFFSFISRLLINKLHYFSLVVFCVSFKAKKTHVDKQFVFT